MLRPAILALLFASTLTSVIIAAAALFGAHLLRRWDLRSGGEGQLRLERRTYLVSTAVGLALAVQAVSLLLFVYNADRMAELFVGAMCAVGTLNVNAYGFPALQVRIALFFLAAVWLVMNHVDSRGYDYPLTRAKYALLLGLAPLALLQLYLEWRYFLGLNPDVITSCCGSLFSAEAEAVTADLAAIEPRLAMGLFALSGVAVIAAALFNRRADGRHGLLLGGLGAIWFVVTLVAVIAFVSPYVYEHPHHHCPFCLLKPEYGYVGYLLYLPLFSATVMALGVAAVRPFAAVPSVSGVIARLSRRLSTAAAVLNAGVVLIVGIIVATSNLMLLE